MIARRLASASAINLLDYAIRFGAVFVVSPFLIHTLGKEPYGLWILLLSLIGYIGVLDLGMSNTAVRFLSASHGRGDGTLFRSQYRFFRGFYLWLSPVAALLAVAGMAIVPWFTKDPEITADARFVILLGGCVTGGSFYFRVHAALIKSHLLYHKLVIAGLIRFLLFTAGIFVFVPSAPGIRTMALLWVGTALIEQFITVFQARHLVPRGPAPPPLEPEAKAEIRGFAAKHLTNVASGMFRGKADILIIGSLISATAVTHYSVGGRFLALFQDLVNALFGSHFLAAFARTPSEGGGDASRDQLFRALRISVPLAWCGGVSLFLLVPPFIDRWLGPGFEESHLVVRWLAIPSALMLMQYPVGPWVGAHNRHGRFAAASLIGGVFNCAASVALVFWLGFVGGVIATAVETSLLALVVWPWLLAKYSAIPPARYARAMLAPVLKLLPATALAVLMARFLPSSSWLDLAIQGTLFAVIFAGSIWFLVLAGWERRQLLSLFLREK